MKTKTLTLTLIILSMLISGCSITTFFKEDKNPAIAEITTTGGCAYVVHSVNGSNKTISGSTYAITHAPVFLGLDNGEEATIHFVCHSCGYEVEDTIIAPFAKLYSCDCPEAIGENGNAREYISISSMKLKIKEIK